MIDAVNRALSRIGFGQLKFNADHFSQLSWMGWGQVAGLLLSLLSIKLTTSAGPSEYGLFILVTSLSGLLSLSLFAPLEQGVVQYLFEYSKTPSQRSSYLRMVSRTLLHAFWYLAASALIISVVGVQFTGYGWMFMIAGSMLVIITVLSIPMNGLLNALKLRKELALIQVTEKALIVMFLQTGIWFVPLDAAVIMTCIVAAMSIMFAARIVVFQRQIGTSDPEAERISVRESAWKKVVMYGWPFVLWGWLTWSQLNGERWVINSYLAAEDVGRYGLASSMVNNSIVMLYTVLIQFITPSVYAKFSSDHPGDRVGGFQLISMMTWVTFILFSLFGLFLYGAGDWLIRLLSNADFVVDAEILFLLTLGMGVFYMGQTLAMVGMALERPTVYVLPKIVSAVISVAVYIAGCLMFGLLGIVFGILIGNLVYLVGIIVVNKRTFAVQQV